uniref:Protein polybromo-1 n=2 Tax=Cacopsylla melanoneura TaxID=428564 RepID=A0A8D9FG91_9HEMI
MLVYDYTTYFRDCTNAKAPQPSLEPARQPSPAHIPSPEDIRPFPKAAPRTEAEIEERARKGKKRRSTQILTDTPIQDQLREEQTKRKDKLAKKNVLKKKELFPKKKKTKLQRIKVEEEEDDEDEEGEGGEKKPKTPSVGVADNAMSFNQQVYRIGDIVYAESKEKGQEPYIVSIERLWTNNEGTPMMYGNHYFRPDETFHVATRKFLEKEVFKSDVHLTLPLSKIQGRCAVVNVKDYFKCRPEGFEPKDVYVCESRYSSKSRSFKKIAKYYPPGHRWATIVFNYKLVERDNPLEPNRVVSVFSERVEKHKQELTELEEREKFVEKVKPNVLLAHVPANAEPDCVYYEQFNSPTGMVIKTGDCVYVCTDPNNVNAKPLIAQIDRTWTDKTGASFIHGPYIVLPADIVVPPNKIFYQKEVLLSATEATNPTTNIIGKCTVLEHSEYISCRPTEIPESEVYIVESSYDPVTKVIRPLPPTGIKKYSHTSAVYQDEIYFFRRLLNPPKVGPTGLIVETPQHHHHQTSAPPSTPSHPPHSIIHTPMQSTPQGHNTPGHRGSMIHTTPHHEVGPFGQGVMGGSGIVGVKEEKIHMGGVVTGMGSNVTPGSSSVYTHNFDSNSNSNSSQMLLAGKMDTTSSSDLMCEDSMDGPPPSVCSVDSTPGGVSTPVSTPISSKKALAAAKKKALVTGYILYSGDVRKQVTTGNPEKTFGEVSRIVGNEWRSLPAAEKAVWEEKAAQINAETAKYNTQVDATIAAQIEAGILVPTANNATNKFFPNHPDLVWECLWDNCDYQFEDMHDCIEHAVADGASGGHIHATFAAIPPSEVEYQCQWRGCSRLKKPFPPFPSCTRLARHVKEVHILKNPGKVVTADHRSKNFVHRIIRTAPSTPQTNTPGGYKGGATPGIGQQQQHQMTVVPKPAEPLFITVPPRPQRLLHSDAYIRYIEGLTQENRTVGRFESQLRASAASTPAPDPSRLPSHWLGNGVGQHGSVLNALWRLREYMFKDTLAITKVI